MLATSGERVIANNGQRYSVDVPKSKLIKPNQMTERQAQIAELRLHGMTQFQIARELGCSQTLVSAELKKIVEIWKDRAAASYDEHVAARLARIDQLSNALRPKLEEGSVMAVDAGIKLEDRAARLLGIDKPVEQKVTISLEAIDNRIAELEAKASAVELDYIEGEIVDDTKNL